MTPSGLPIDAVLPALRAALRDRAWAVLQAPPGAGKSTVVPLALLEEPWVQGRKIIVLEPRRLAARAVATRMATTLGESVGQRVGYRMRLDTRVSRNTRIEVVTEGVLARLLQEDPALESAAAILFDEFHERSLQADLGLALTLDACESLRPDLRVLVMSATLDGEGVARLLRDAPIVTASGRQYPVDMRYVGRASPILPGGDESPERVMVGVIRRALDETEGDMLAFLPGAAEIRRVEQGLRDGALPPKTTIWPLYGELSGDAQTQALEPSPPGTRRIVLSTNIAETSLTLPGITVVVDSGLVKRSAFDPATGMSRLETRRISRASADQRAGRAGRTAPGVAYRMWSDGAQRSLAAFTAPEIVEADLTALALELAVWGTRDTASLAWLDPPPEAQLASAYDLLRQLEAVDAQRRPTDHGRAMATIAAHPRVAHMLLRAGSRSALREAAEIAALLGERDLLRGYARDADVRSRLDVLRGGSNNADRATVARVRRSAEAFERSVPAARTSTADSQTGALREFGALLALAYPDRIGRRRAGGEGRYALSNGRGAKFRDMQLLAQSEFIVALDLDDVDREARILLAAPVSREALERELAPLIVERDDVDWDAREQAVIARRRRMLGELVLDERPLREVPQDLAIAGMLRGVRSLGLDALPWNRDARDLQARIQFVHSFDAAHAQAWADSSDDALAASLEEWLPVWLTGITRRSHLDRLSMTEILRARLSGNQSRELDKLAPTHLQMPTGSNIRVDYSNPTAPTVAVRMQEVFGLADSPRLGGGRVPITFTLLSPAQRPLQITRELASFWRGAYAEVRKDMRGRYPRHYWPENPLEAEPTRGVRRRT